MKTEYHASGDSDGNAQKRQGGFPCGATEVSAAAYDAAVRRWAERYREEDFSHWHHDGDSEKVLRTSNLKKVRRRPRFLAPVVCRSASVA